MIIACFVPARGRVVSTIFELAALEIDGVVMEGVRVFRRRSPSLEDGVTARRNGFALARFFPVDASMVVAIMPVSSPSTPMASRPARVIIKLTGRPSVPSRQTGIPCLARSSRIRLRATRLFPTFIAEALFKFVGRSEEHTSELQSH